MEIRAQIEQMSGLLSRSFTTQQGEQRTIEYVEVVLNNGLERIFCESAHAEQARQILHDVKIGDNVVAMLRTWASTAKRQSGETFWLNRTRIVNLQKEFQIGQTLPQTF